MDRILQIQQWFRGQLTEDALRKNALQLIGLGFLIVLLVGLFYGASLYMNKSGLHAQDLKAIAACQDRYRQQYAGHNLSFSGLTPLRFGNTHIIVTGNASYAEADGHIRNIAMNCNLLVDPSKP